MKPILYLVAFMLSWMILGEAQAQFKYPPPSTSPPSCSREKSGPVDQPPSSSDCKAAAAYLTDISIHCQSLSQSVLCHAAMLVYTQSGWELLDPSTLTHHWAYIVDGVEVYLPPNHWDSVAIECGNGRYGDVRIAAGGDVAQIQFQCPPATVMEW
jgi:hypothetical protein